MERPIITIEYQRRFKAAKDRALKLLPSLEVLRIWETVTTTPGVIDFSEERLNRFESAVATLELL